jgi:hypothetical protein
MFYEATGSAQRKVLAGIDITHAVLPRSTESAG